MRLPASLLLCALAGCTGASGRESEAGRWTECGLGLAFHRWSSVPGQAGIESGDALTACALPTDEEIARLCESRHADPIPGRSSPEDPSRRLYAYPNYEVFGARCSWANAERSAADCRFLLSGPRVPPRVRVRLVHRFREVSGDVVLNWLRAGWEIEGSCLPAAPLAGTSVGHPLAEPWAGS